MNLSDEQRFDLVKPFAYFLSMLHSVFEKSIIEKEILTQRILPTSLESLDVTHLASLVSLNLKKVDEFEIYPYTRSFDQIIEESQGCSSDLPLCLVHGDLYSRHLLMNSKQELSGIIDWGDSHLGNPALDLQIVFTFFPPSAQSKFFQEYGNISEKTKRVVKLRALYSASNTAVYSQAVGDQNLLRESKVALKYLDEAE